jgi:hypothetical protein
MDRSVRSTFRSSEGEGNATYRSEGQCNLNECQTPNGARISTNMRVVTGLVELFWLCVLELFGSQLTIRARGRRHQVRLWNHRRLFLVCDTRLVDPQPSPSLFARKSRLRSFPIQEFYCTVLYDKRVQLST